VTISSGGKDFSSAVLSVAISYLRISAHTNPGSNTEFNSVEVVNDENGGPIPRYGKVGFFLPQNLPLIVIIRHSRNLRTSSFPMSWLECFPQNEFSANLLILAGSILKSLGELTKATQN
jgi:hypothetical protein